VDGSLLMQILAAITKRWLTDRLHAKGGDEERRVRGEPAVEHKQSVLIQAVVPGLHTTILIAEAALFSLWANPDPVMLDQT
jgi:hypothetical protein